MIIFCSYPSLSPGRKSRNRATGEFVTGWRGRIRERERESGNVMRREPDERENIVGRRRTNEKYLSLRHDAARRQRDAGDGRDVATAFNAFIASMRRRWGKRWGTTVNTINSPLTTFKLW